MLILMKILEFPDCEQTELRTKEASERSQISIEDSVRRNFRNECYIGET